MNGCHKTIFNADFFIQHSHEWRQSICCAGGIRNNLMFFTKFSVVYAINNCQVCGFGGGTNQYALTAGFNMRHALLFGVECPRTFQDDINVEFFPR